jgi:hypothetical protein
MRNFLALGPRLLQAAVYRKSRKGRFIQLIAQIYKEALSAVDRTTGMISQCIIEAVMYFNDRQHCNSSLLLIAFRACPYRAWSFSKVVEQCAGRP